ncbi:Mesoderm induction early response protein 2 [Acipenser ruthenus]|uniref:Mesoderm induction early response protein 2 n=1 Tax=Acipenser ruthenus TaxID=7906 RepID=A0A444V2Z6_ACIRT|nr:Mesoderm induction early response protein 2 [Acipenser ruthenus]
MEQGSVPRDMGKSCSLGPDLARSGKLRWVDPAVSMGSDEHGFNLAEILSHSYGSREHQEECEAQRSLEELEKSLHGSEGSEMPLEELLALYGYEASDPISEHDSEGHDLPHSLPDMTLDKEQIAKDLLSGEEEEEAQSSADDLTPSVTSHDASDLFPHPLHANSIVDEDKDSSSSSSEEESEDDSVPSNECRKDIMVGPQYQAMIPPLILYTHQERAYESEDQLLWDPHVLPEGEVERFLRRAERRSCEEASLESLQEETLVRDNEQVRRGEERGEETGRDDGDQDMDSGEGDGANHSRSSPSTPVPSTTSQLDSQFLQDPLHLGATVNYSIIKTKKSTTFCCGNRVRVEQLDCATIPSRPPLALVECKTFINVTLHLVFDRTVVCVWVSEAVKSAVPSPRILQLARPKRRYPPVARESLIWSPEQGISIVTEAACSAVATPRLQDLATAKKVHPLFLPEKPTAWPVPESAMKVVASDRVHMLAKPKVQKGIFEGYDPYLVTETAKQAQASPRVLELSMPLPRKVRHKKI